jgi:hypothetical protein
MAANDKELLWTPKGNSYWEENGVYQAEYEKLFDELVPGYGSARTINGELIRCVNRLFYDYCNNGNGNAQEHEYEEEDCWICNGGGEDEDGDDCEDCGGAGTDYEAISVYSIREDFDDMLEFLANYVDRNQVERIRGIIKSPDKCGDFSDDVMCEYNKLSDMVMHYVLSHDDTPNPQFKEED